jgi:homocitrate synthase NifV
MNDVLCFPRLLEASEAVARASGRPVGWHKSIVGEGVFTHEAGIHVDGLLKDPANYQGVDPALLGRHHRMLLGKHSGEGEVHGERAAAAGHSHAVNSMTRSALRTVCGI